MKSHNKPGRGGEELEISRRRGEIEARRLQAAMDTVLTQNWGPESPTVRVAFDALLRALERQ